MPTTGKTLGVTHNDSELAIINWLKVKLRRTASGTYKTLAAEKAEELGYSPLKQEKTGPKASRVRKK